MKVVAAIVLVLCVYLGLFLRKNVSDLCEVEKCPICYGTDLCDDFDRGVVRFSYDSFTDLFNNWFSVKNLYFAYLGDSKVVLKKLAHDSELRALDNAIFTPINDTLSTLVHFKTCNDDVRAQFLTAIYEKYNVEEIWSILVTNVEPLLLQMFRNEDGWPVPRFFGSCGRVIVEEYCGIPLNNLENFNWYVRAFLGAQLLEAAVNFTVNHPTFRLYLTDISPDNIVVDLTDFKIYFVDLENAILTESTPRNGRIHYSEYFGSEDAGYVYSEDSVCNSSISDHNVFAICQLILSRNAPWPMMYEGLLHSPPFEVEVKYSKLFSLVENCVYSNSHSDRFMIAEQIIRILKKILDSL